MEETSFGGDVGKGAVAVVFEKVIGRLLADGKTFQTRAVDEENVHPAIIVVIVEGDSTTGGFEKIFVLVLAPEDSFGVQAGLTPDIEEAYTEIVCAGIGQLGRCGNGLSRGGELHAKQELTGKNFFEQQAPRAVAQ